MPEVRGQHRIYGVARSVLDCVANALNASGATAPARQYVADGNLVAWDCEQLCVAVAQTIGHAGNPAAEDASPVMGMVQRAAALEVWLVRCCPTMDDDGNPPKAEAIDASAQIVLADPTVMIAALWEALQAGTLGTCRGLVLRGWTAVGPSGGLTGGVLRLNVNLTEV